MPPSPSSRKLKRLRSERAGRRAEGMAAMFLMLQLYRIRARRFKTPVGEIDLVASRLGTTVFVEVKARASRETEGEAMLAVNRRRIIRAAQYYIARHPDLANTSLRFDVIFLAPFAWPRHVRNAFTA